MSTNSSLTRIAELLGIFAQQVRILNYSQELSINTHSENIFLKILNLIFDLNLINANSIKRDFAAIDLIDTKKRVAFQITSTNELPKINGTLKKIIDRRNDEYYKDIDELYVYIITDRLNKYDQDKINETTKGIINFDVDKHIIDKKNLYAILKNQNDLDKIDNVLAYLEREITGKIFKKSIKTTITFDEQDWQIAKKVIKELSERNILIYSNSNRLKDEIQDFNNKVFIIDNEFSEVIDYCIVINTNTYSRTKWNDKSKCPILKYALKGHSTILPFKYKGVAEIREITTKSVVIHNNDSDFIVKSFIEQALIYDEQAIKEYKDIRTIIDLYKPNEEYKTIDKDCIPSQKIGYELFEAVDPIFKKSEYILYLHENIAQQKTYDYIFHRKSKIYSGNNLLILISRPKNLKNPETLKQNISKIFKPISIFFIDEFVWQFCTSPEFRSKTEKYQLPSFVHPYMQDSFGNIVSTEYITEWLDKEQNPLLVLLGAGGIGKTTVAQKISDLIVDNRPSTKVIFIYAPKIVEQLVRNAQDEEENINLYKFYEANHDSNKANYQKINTESFRIHIDNGNVLIIIDGLDEIISRAWKYFNVNDFIQSIYNLTNEVGKGKVIITCRDFFWNTSNDVNDKFEKLVLQPFNDEKAELFFSTKFSNHAKKSVVVRKGIELSKLILGGNSTEYMPFVLEQVAYMIDEGVDNNVLQDETFKSKLLNKQIKNDYILYKICTREVTRLNQIDVDKQVKFFINFALASNKSNIKALFDNIFNENIDEKLVDKFKAHPLLNVQNCYTSFRYDFFDSHFKNIYLGELLNKKINIDSDLISILSDKIKYNHTFVKDIADRIDSISDGWEFPFMSAIDEITNNFSNIHDRVKRKAISGLFIIALQRLHLKSNTIEENTKLLNLLFNNKGVITNLSIFNITDSDNKKIIFNFSNLKFRNCYFQNYDFFWDCKFDEKSVFENCYFYNLGSNINRDLKLTESNFINPCNDDSLSNVLKENKQKTLDFRDKVVEDFKSFVHTLCKSGYCSHLPVEKIKAKKYGPYLLSSLEDVLLNFYLHKESGKKYCEIKEEYRQNIIAYYKDTQISAIINESIKRLIENYKSG